MANLDFEQISFQIIAYAGEAKTHAMNSMEHAKSGDFHKAQELLGLADESMINAEKAHMDVITQEANGIKIDIPVIFMHAEDQLLSTQTLMLVAQQFLDLYKTLK